VKRVLLVEDEVWLAEALRDKLESMGYKVTLALSESEGRDALEGNVVHTYGLAVIDLMLPAARLTELGRLDCPQGDSREAGLRLCEHIRRERHIPADELPIIVYSVWEDRELKRGVVGLGAKYVAKGTPLEYLLRAISESFPVPQVPFSEHNE